MDRAIGLVRRYGRTLVAGIVLALVVPAVAFAVTTTVSPGHTGLSKSCVKADCHPSDLAAIHAKQGCDLCHAAGKTPTKVCGTAGCHPKITGMSTHPRWNTAHLVLAQGSCFGTNCHAGATDVRSMHTGLKCATCHASGTDGLTVVCASAGCHSPTDSHPIANAHPTMSSGHTGLSKSCAKVDCHPADITAIHAKQGCALCHAAGKTPTKVCGTAGCHPKVTGMSTHARWNTAHVVQPQAACFGAGCHTGATDVRSMHTGLKCATCHVNGTDGLTVVCASAGCHPDGAGASHTSHPATLTSAAFRINNLNYGTYACTLCHPSTDLQVIHGGASSCPKCHPGPASSAKPWDGGCTQTGCHAATSAHPMHTDVSASHLTTTQPSCTQTGCHFGNSSVGGRDVVLMHFAKQGCATCHGPGKTPTLDCVKCHPEALTGDHQNAHKICNDCHAPFVWNNATATANKGANLGVVHWSMFDANWTVLIGRAKIRPGYPHGDYTMLVFPGPIGGPGPYTSAPYPAGNTGTYTCTTCHTGAGKVWVHPGSDYFTCGSGGDCHQHHGNWDPAELSDSYVHNTPPASWRVVMKW